MLGLQGKLFNIMISFSKINIFYNFRALAEAMQTVQHTKHFAHPANWAGFILIGGNVRLSNKVALIGQALCELMRTPDKCRDALRVCFTFS